MNKKKEYLWVDVILISFAVLLLGINFNDSVEHSNGGRMPIKEV